MVDPFSRGLKIDNKFGKIATIVNNGVPIQLIRWIILRM